MHLAVPDRFARLAQVLVDASPHALIAMSAAGEVFFWSNGADTRTLPATIAARLEGARR